MTQFYRKSDPSDKTIYQTYDPKTGQFGGGISSEQQAQQLGVVPDWEASWKPAGAATNIQTITPPTPGISQTPPSTGPQALTPGQLPEGAVRDASGKVYYPGGIVNQSDQAVTPTVASQFTEGSLVRAEGTPEVYTMTPGGMKAHIPDPETFEKLYGADAWGSIKIISPEQLGAIPTTDPLSAQFIGNKVGDTRNNPQTGKREVLNAEGNWIPAEAFTPGTTDQVSTLAAASGATLDTGIEAAIKEGDLVRAEGTPEVYLTTKEGLKHITSPAQFEQLGYKWENVRDITPGLIASYKQGQSVDSIMDQFNSSISDISQIIQDIQNSTQIKDLEEEQKSWREQITQSLADFASKVTSAAKDPTVIAREAELAELTPKIATMEGEMELVLEKSGQRKESIGFIKGEQAQIRNIYNIELKTMYAKQAALQGNLDLARELAQDAIDTALKQEEIKLQTLQQALAFTEADLTREDKKASTALQFALIQYQSNLEQTRQDAQNRANTYAKIIATYGDVPNLDPSMDVTAQWALVGPQATTERNLRMAALQKQISGTTDTIQTGVIPAIDAAKLGVPYGTTYEQYSAMSAPQEWSDNQFSVAFRNMLAKDMTYQQALDEVSLDASITNKDRGKFLAAQMWGQIEPGVDQAVFEGKASPIDIEKISKTKLPTTKTQTERQEFSGFGIFEDYKGVTLPDVFNLYK